MLNDVEATKVFLLNPNSEIIFVWLRIFSCLTQIGLGSPGSVLTVTFAAAGLTLACLDLRHLGCPSTESTFVTLTLAAAGFGGVAPTVMPTFAGGGLTLASVDLRCLAVLTLTSSAAGFGGFGLTVTLTGADVFGKGDGDFDHDLLDLLFCGGVRDLDLLWYDFLQHDFLELFLLLFHECFFLFLW